MNRATLDSAVVCVWCYPWTIRERNLYTLSYLVVHNKNNFLNFEEWMSFKSWEAHLPYSLPHGVLYLVGENPEIALVSCWWWWCYLCRGKLVQSSSWKFLYKCVHNCSSDALQHFCWDNCFAVLSFPSGGCTNTNIFIFWMQFTFYILLQSICRDAHNIHTDMHHPFIKKL